MTQIDDPRDENTGGTFTWQEFFALMDAIDVPADFMAERPLNVPPRERNIFEDAD